MRGLGAALGVKVARPEKQVVAIMGDGTFNYNARLPGLSYCQEYDTPITIIMINNSCYHAMKMALEEVSPNGVAISTGAPFVCDLNPSVDYEKNGRTRKWLWRKSQRSEGRQACTRPGVRG